MRYIWALFCVLFSVSFVALAGPHPVVKVVKDFSIPKSWDNRVAMPYFDENNNLLWNGELVMQAGDCFADWFTETNLISPRCRRSTVMLNPRVDECSCTGNTQVVGMGVSVVAYVGIDEHSSERWRRLGLVSGQGPELFLTGATPDGLVFSNFEVWSPYTGETLRSALSSYGRYSSSCYLPTRGVFLKFEAEVSLFRVKGGLYLYTADGKRELVLPVDRGLLGYFEIESITPVPGTSILLLGESYHTRGPGSARFVLFDLDTKRVLFRDELSEGHLVADVRVTAGTDGHVAFSFLDETTGKYKVVHYLLQ
jgi:hypothetical protein